MLRTRNHLRTLVVKKRCPYARRNGKQPMTANGRIECAPDQLRRPLSHRTGNLRGTLSPPRRTPRCLEEDFFQPQTYPSQTQQVPTRNTRSWALAFLAVWIRLANPLKKDGNRHKGIPGAQIIGQLSNNRKRLSRKNEEYCLGDLNRPPYPIPFIRSGRHAGIFFSFPLTSPYNFSAFPSGQSPPRNGIQVSRCVLVSPNAFCKAAEGAHIHFTGNR